MTNTNSFVVFAQKYSKIVNEKKWYYLQNWNSAPMVNTLKEVIIAILLDWHHDDVYNGNVVDWPSNELGFIEIGPGFANTKADMNTPNQEEKFTWNRGFF